MTGQFGGPRRLLAGAVLSSVLLGAAACGSSAGSPAGAEDGTTPGGSVASAPAGPTATPSAGPTAKAESTTRADQGPQPLPASTGVHVTSVRVDAIGLKTTGLEKLALQSDQTLAAPKDPDKAGWYADGALPGQTGPAVIAGHVDSTTGPAVFADLGEMKRGQTIKIGLSDGTTSTFRVDQVVHTAKDEFPTDQVYGPTPDAQLRLITCSGTYDRSRGGYLDNTVVFASSV